MPMNPRLLRPLATGGFSPKKIAGLQLWLDAADSSTITTDTGVSQWRDKSGTANAFVQDVGNNQPATGTQTINGKNVLVFDGSNDSMSISSPPMSTSMPLTFVMVKRLVATGSFGMFYTTGTGDNFNIRQESATGRLQVAAGGSVVATGLATTLTGVNIISTLVFPSAAGSNIRVYRNGSRETVGTFTATKPTLTGTHYIGRRSDGLNANFWLAEIIAYNADLSDTQRQSIERYLGKKWGISVP